MTSAEKAEFALVSTDSTPVLSGSPIFVLCFAHSTLLAETREPSSGGGEAL